MAANGRRSLQGPLDPQSPQVIAAKMAAKSLPDLGALAAQRRQKQELIQQIQMQWGLLCQCGKRIVGEGLRAHIIKDSGQLGSIQAVVMTFCADGECAPAKEWLPQAFAISHAPSVEWCEDVLPG